LSPRPSSPSERRCPELDDAIVLNDAEQPQAAGEPGRAALVIAGFCDELRIIGKRLAGIGRMRRQSKCRRSSANRLLRNGR